MTEQAIGPVLYVETNTPRGQQVLKALASEPRLRILELLGERLSNVSEIAEALHIPVSTANLHVSILENAGLLITELQPAKRGVQKVCARAYEVITISLPVQSARQEARAVEASVPVGSYVDCQVTPTCGLAGRNGLIGLLDDAASFYEPERVNAQLIWFHHGYVEYRLPNRLPPKAEPTSLQVSAEICSEAPMHHDDWPSDITVWINGVDIGTWTSPADFGGQRGILTPQWWETRNTQYGLLKVWQVNREAAFVDGVKVSDVRLSDLELAGSSFLSVRIGVRADAEHVGGINLFGSSFGNYPQDIVVRINHR
jgi:predicted transcriptional regulator